MTAKKARPAFETFTIDGFDLEVPVEAISPPLRERLVSGIFEVPERALLTRFLLPGDRVLDLGAGAGLVSLTAARVVGDGSVVSVEANPQMHPALRRNFRRNGAARIELIKGAVVGADHAADDVTLHVNPGFWSGSLYVNPQLRHVPVAVRAKRLPQLLRRSRATVVVMDIEGAEAEVLARPLPAGVRLLVVELHPAFYGREGSDAIMAQMQGQGFAPHFHREWREVVAFLREPANQNC